MAQIVFIDGPDYSGKTTLINRLSVHFQSKGLKVATFKEPSGEFRKMLLDKDKEYTPSTRRLLYQADHVEMMDNIYKVFNNYDYIIVDRCALISDNIYSKTEIKSEFLLYELGNHLSVIHKALDYEDYESIFRMHSHLIMLRLPKNTFKERINQRKVDETDLLDSKPLDFKMDIFEKYNTLTDELMTGRQSLFLKGVFDTISSIRVDKNIENNAIKLLEGWNDECV